MNNVLLNWLWGQRSRPVAKVATCKPSRKEVIREVNARSESVCQRIAAISRDLDVNGMDPFDIES